MKQTILIVEDDRDLRKMFRTALVLEGFEVLEAENGFNALWLLDRVLPPDLILLDLMMPVLDGRTVRNELAAQAHLRDIPIVVVTAEPGPHLDLDAACVLRKPVDPENLIRTIRLCLKSGAAT